MGTKVTPLDDFDHNDIRAKRGVAIEVSDSLANQLEERGLVQVGKIKLEPTNRMRRAAEKKTNAPADGEGAESSASQAGQASATRTAKSSGTGAKTTRKAGK